MQGRAGQRAGVWRGRGGRAVGAGAARTAGRARGAAAAAAASGARAAAARGYSSRPGASLGCHMM